MKFYQLNKLIMNDRAKTADFIKEIRDFDDRLISYVYMGRAPISSKSRYHYDWIEFKENGTTKRPYYEFVS